MGKIKKDELEELLSYRPSKEQRLMILAEVQTSGKSIAEVADRYAMPPLFVKDAEGLIEYKSEKMTAEQFTAKFPHRRFVTLASREQKEKLDKLKK